MNWSDARHRLPDHDPRPDLWERLDCDPRLLDLRADTALDLALRQLPQHDPAPDLWARLDADLSADETLDRALTTLPEFEPKADLWAAVNDRLNSPEPRSDELPFRIWRNTGFGQRVIRGAAAASVLLGLLGGYWLYQRTGSSETVTVAYSVETTDVLPTDARPESTTEQQADQDFEVFINQACEQQVLACKKPEVQNLRQQLAELDQRKAQIDGQLRVFGEDPDLVKAQVRIENERADVAKELVNILNI